jgi:ubiquinone/menaquinone biosynthesis C-methylase UbiE
MTHPTDLDERALFAVAADGYDRLMGRYLPTLGPRFAEAAGVGAGMRVLDVGCGPGGLTSVLVRMVGAEPPGSGTVAALDPSPTFVAACRDRNPQVDVHLGVAEDLPFADDSFDASLASLVVGFMSDPVAGVREMRRVTRPGGRVALAFWTQDAMPLLSTFWRAVAAVVGPSEGEDHRLGRQEGDLKGLLERVGAADVVESRLGCSATYADLDDWWSSFTGGAGPVGAYQQSLSPELRARVREECDRLLGHPRAPFTLEAFVWCAIGVA